MKQGLIMHALHLLLRAFFCCPLFMAGKLFLLCAEELLEGPDRDSGLLFRLILMKAFQFEAVLTSWCT